MYEDLVKMSTEDIRSGKEFIINYDCYNFIAICKTWLVESDNIYITWLVQFLLTIVFIVFKIKLINSNEMIKLKHRYASYGNILFFIQ